ncbi:hypothetical protein THZG08_10083 [Vibrio owensii]|nr:hypothetical protein THZG08_10083 [Vibrio owensii]CAH1548451.1 hypothetical protein THOA03_10083 [Vibrio owensii]
MSKRYWFGVGLQAAANCFPQITKSGHYVQIVNLIGWHPIKSFLANAYSEARFPLFRQCSKQRVV